MKVGDVIPSATVAIVKADQNGVFSHETVNTAEYFFNKKVVLFGYLSVMTRTSTATHYSEFIEAADEIKSHGADEIFAVSLTDPSATKAFAHHLGATHEINFMADGNHEFSKALGIEIQPRIAMLGVRNKRFSMLIEGNEIVEFNCEEGTKLTEKSGAQTMLRQIKN